MELCLGSYGNTEEEAFWAFLGRVLVLTSQEEVSWQTYGRCEYQFSVMFRETGLRKPSASGPWLQRIILIKKIIPRILCSLKDQRRKEQKSTQECQRHQGLNIQVTKTRWWLGRHGWGVPHGELTCDVYSFRLLFIFSHGGPEGMFGGRSASKLL